MAEGAGMYDALIPEQAAGPVPDPLFRRTKASGKLLRFVFERKKVQ